MYSIGSVLLFERPTITRIQVLLLTGWLPPSIRQVESMPNLRILQIVKCYWGGPVEFLLGAESFPRLDELVVHLMRLPPPVAVGSPAPLRTIDFCDITGPDWVNVVSECRETLVEVFLCRCRLSPPTQIHLPNLKFLALSDMFDSRNNIVAPSLNTFHEHFSEPAPPELPLTFSSFTEYACRIPPRFWRDELLLDESVFPNLERFVLWSTLLGIRVVLGELVSYPHAFPKLKTIELVADDGEELCDDNLAKLEKLVVHTPLSSVLKLQTHSMASFARLRFFWYVVHQSLRFIFLCHH